MRANEWNKAAMIRHIWNPCQIKVESIWARWVKTYVLRNKSLSEIRIPKVALGLGGASLKE